MVARDSGGALWHKARGGRSCRVCTVAEACRILGRTRRQVYRRIQDGSLKACGKFLGEWLLPAADVAALAERPRAVQPIPRRFQEFFPEYSISKLNAGSDRVLVVGRLLETGGMDAIRWLLRRYQTAGVRTFIEEDGARLLSPRSLRWWSLAMNARPRPLPAWRASEPWRAA